VDRGLRLVCLSNLESQTTAVIMNAVYVDAVAFAVGAFAAA